ncbi:ribosomal RNA processing protein 1 homolog [Quercus lobata]|uniref:Uncharacterized protein n=1 Tax=Quercus lobata TaxID=97700 RepID=A0A7N2MY27_QUELO|nr:ribosomal RNA processing protein 1 homolog [Quercus lobata]
MGSEESDPEVEMSSLIKQLANCNQTARNKALRLLLKTWLPSQQSLSEEDLKKLWKGLFYCVWHADNHLFQSQLIDRLSSLLLRLPLPLSFRYLACFLLTIRREWPGIDALRLDKFYLLIRRFLHYSFVLLKTQKWDLGVCVKFVDLLLENTVYANDKFRGNGVNYHVVSVFLEELRAFLPVRAEVVGVLLKPFVSVMGKSGDKVLCNKIKGCVFDVLVKMGVKLLEVKKVGGAGCEVDSREDFVVFGTIALTMGFSKEFYEMGSSAECLQGNRKVLFGLYEAFSKLEKDFAASGVEVSIPDIVENDEDEEVPTLVPIAPEVKMGGDAVNGCADDDKALKKCKNKDKKKKDSSGSGKTSTKKKKKQKNEISDMIIENGPTGVENENVVIANGDNSVDEIVSDGSLIEFNESVISNLQMQFEKVAAEAGLENDVASARNLPKIKVNGTVSKKRKRTKSMDGKQSQNHELNTEGDAEGGMTAKSGEKSAKKVRFSMKNNLVWKPQSPLPPQSVRIPPSVTPRGSALKKGVPPGPIREMLPATKMMKKRAVAVKKVRKGKKSISPAAKRVKKLKSRSP